MKHTLKEWFFATRPWGYGASIIPALLAYSFVFYQYKTGNLPNINIRWWLGGLAALAAAIYQASGNMMSDYYDYKYNVDRKESFGSSRMLLVEGKFTPKEIYWYSMSYLILGSLIGIFFLISGVSLNLLWIGAIGVLGTYFYYFLKFRALGDLNIFIIYGQLIALGTFLVMTDTIDWKVLLLSASLGLLLVNILHANNMRDINSDKKAHIKTQAMLLGYKKSVIEYIILGYGAYFIIVLCVVLGIISWINLVVFVTLPIMMKNIKTIKSADVDHPEIIKTMDAQTAQHLTIFGIVLVIANFIAGIIAYN